MMRQISKSAIRNRGHVKNWIGKIPFDRLLIEVAARMKSNRLVIRRGRK